MADESPEEKSRRLLNRRMTLDEAKGRFTPDRPSPSDPFGSRTYMNVADTASALGLPMPAPQGPGGMYTQQQAVDFAAANPVPNRLGIAPMSPQDALAGRMANQERFRQWAAQQPDSAGPLPMSSNIDEMDNTVRGAPMFGIRGRMNAMNPGAGPVMPQQQQPGIMNSLARMFGY